MSLLKQDEEVAFLGFASTCKTKCVNLEGDELSNYCITHCTRHPGCVQKRQTDPQEWMRTTFENTDRDRDMCVVAGWYAKLKSGNQILIADNYQQAIEHIQAYTVGGSDLHITKVTFHDGSRIQRVYKNVYVAFNSLGYQDGVEICKTINEVLELSQMISYPPGSEDAYFMDNIEFDNGYSILYKDATERR